MPDDCFICMKLRVVSVDQLNSSLPFCFAWYIYCIYIMYIYILYIYFNIYMCVYVYAYMYVYK